LHPVKLKEWASQTTVSNKRRIERGTFQELAVEFDAGEGYERWYLAPDWAPYRGYFNWAETQVKAAADAGADKALLALADKQLLVANWETAWHTPATGPHGDSDVNGHASPWARALTSHSRLAAVTAEAALWMTKRDGQAHVAACDIDNDGETEIVLRNQYIFAVLTPKWGGRVVAMFSLAGDGGAMVIGNPCDDWNWMEELNRYMDVPRNHPGAFADVGLEHEEYTAEIVTSDGESAAVLLESAQHLRKHFQIDATSHSIRVTYELPKRMKGLSTEFAFSPDYLKLLRCGSLCAESWREAGAQGCRTGSVAVWVRPAGDGIEWETPYQPRCGHAFMLRAGSKARRFQIELGVTELAASPANREAAAERVLV
jgi:hypothetical protein